MCVAVDFFGTLGRAGGVAPNGEKHIRVVVLSERAIIDSRLLQSR
jgi:hypothetical protein